MLTDWLINCLTRRETRVPIVYGTLEGLERNSLKFEWEGVSGHSPFYRLRVDGEHYFLLPKELDLFSSGQTAVRQLVKRERIVLAYRVVSSGRRILAWALQPQVSVVCWSEPHEELRRAINCLGLGLGAFLGACGTWHLGISGLLGWGWVMLPGVLCGLIAMLLLGLALFGLWDLRTKDRFVYHRACQEAIVALSSTTQEGPDGV